MGFEKNRGLGVNSQGRTEPIEESKQKGRRGLGFTLDDFNDETAEWDFDDDPVNKLFSSLSHLHFILYL
jgi:cap1 methyltransferase